MSNFPTNIDDDDTLPFVNDNINDIGGEAINAVRDAVINIETEIGTGASGSSGTISNRLSGVIMPDGSLNPSALTGLGLVSLPITNSQVGSNAKILESKLLLDHKTTDLYNYISSFNSQLDVVLDWMSATGIKLDPHLIGAIYRHSLTHIDIYDDSSKNLKNRFSTLLVPQYRDSVNAFWSINDLNDEVLFHQFADGSNVIIPEKFITTHNGSVYPANYAHTASGLWINTSRFETIPQTVNDLQLFAEFVDESGILLLGSRMQNLYSNGISRVSRSTVLDSQLYGDPIVPITPVITHLLKDGTVFTSVDDINYGDDIIEFKPTGTITDNFVFDSKFAKIKVGDVIRVNYGDVEVLHLVKEKKHIVNGSNKTYIIRINGLNLRYTNDATARIDRSLVNGNKFGVLSVAAANNPDSTSNTPSLIVVNPRAAQTLGVGFNPDHIDHTSYNLYLTLYPKGDPALGSYEMPAIDVSGNRGATPGAYTLESVVEATNNAFRKAGYNYRFNAFSYEGEFGIALSDAYNNASFSITNGSIDSAGNFDESLTNINYPNNVIQLFDSYKNNDALGFGSSGSGIASPTYKATFGSFQEAASSTKVIIPHRRNNFYVDGSEKDRLTLDIGQVRDDFGDGFWLAHIVEPPTPLAGPPGRLITKYRIDSSLFNSQLKPGKTIVVQPYDGYGTLIDFGRFIIDNVTYGDCDPDIFTDIEVFDSVHANGTSPAPTLGEDGYVHLYLNSDSVSFNKASATDSSENGKFKRHFEVYIDKNSNTFTHERARFIISGSDITLPGGAVLRANSELSKFDILKVSPKLRAYEFGSSKKISLRITNNNTDSGEFTGYLCSFDGVNDYKRGPVITGKRGESIRFYNDSNSDYIDFYLDINSSLPSISGAGLIMDIQIFPTLLLDDEVMPLAVCQLNDTTNKVSKLIDVRQFGNISEKDLSTSALDFISSGERLLHGNGVIRGFNIEFMDPDDNPNNNKICLTGGVALVNGKFIQKKSEVVVIPNVVEYFSSTYYPINWAVCINSKGEYQPIPLLDYDPIIGTPNNLDRTITLARLDDLLIRYNVDATTFSDLINNRKDLVLLYIVASQEVA